MPDKLVLLERKVLFDPKEKVWRPYNPGDALPEGAKQEGAHVGTEKDYKNLLKKMEETRKAKEDRIKKAPTGPEVDKMETGNVTK